VHGRAGWVAAGQDGLFAVLVAGAVDGKAPGGGRSGVAEPHQGQGGAVGELIDSLRAAGVILTYDPGQQTLCCTEDIAVTIGNSR
jgi:hypothetical protein